VGGEDDGLVEGGEVADDVPRVAAGGGIETGRGFVEEEQLLRGRGAWELREFGG
jgi:hypothetical protein